MDSSLLPSAFDPRWDCERISGLWTKPLASGHDGAQSHAGASSGSRPRRPPPYSGSSRTGLPWDRHRRLANSV